jgi:ABC-type antimicrobial peptide transport system permease subunit
MRAPVEPAIHVPLTAFASGQLVVRAYGPVAGLAGPVRRELAQALPGARLVFFEPLDTFLAPELGAHRFALALLGAFAAAGLALALIGLFGVMSYAVARRNYEFGIRLALGARGGQVIRLVAARGAAIVVIGMAVGTAGSAIASRVLVSYLGSISVHDPLTYGVALTALAVTALLAILIPAMRTLRIDPAQALRHE